MILSGCSNKHGSEMITEARDLTTSQISVNPSKNDYGAPAYELLKQIQSDYPGRIAGAEKEKEMALFILSVLLNGGYSENDISVQSFTISDTAPAMAESINIFDGGEKSNLPGSPSPSPCPSPKRSGRHSTGTTRFRFTPM